MTRGPAKQFDRDEVLARAMELFWEQGYEATSLPQLLECMGIGRQSLYDTFGDKRSLYLEALGRYFEERQSLAKSILCAEGSPLGNLRRMFDKMIELSSAKEGYGCFMGNAVAEFGDRDPGMARATQAFFDGLRGLFVETLLRAQSEGELPPGAPVEDIAEMFVVTSQGLALLGKIDPDPARASRLVHTSISLLNGGLAG